jgi:hypothetical protein
MMCKQCEDDFAYFTKDFDEILIEYRNDRPKMRDTPAERVHDLAAMFQNLVKEPGGELLQPWLLAIAIERLMALEMAGMLT